MIKKIVIFIAVMVVVPFFNVAHAATVDFVSNSSREYQAGELVEINGAGFGTLDEGSWICFSSDEYCFSQTSYDVIDDGSGIRTWNDGLIEFYMPSDLPQSGSITVYMNYDESITTFSYSMKPTIDPADSPQCELSIFDFLGNCVWDSYPGEVLRIEGSYFGNSEGTIDFGIVDADIEQWLDNEIVLTVPDVSMDTKTLTICNDDGLCSEKEEFHVQPAFFNDTWLYYQYYLREIDFDKAYNLLSVKEPIIVAVLDDGVYFNHEDIIGSVWKNTSEMIGDGEDNDGNGFTDDVYGWNFIDDSNSMETKGDHGTAVAGIIGAQRNNNLGMAGIADGIKIMPIIVCSQNGCDADAIEDGIKYAVDNGARVINLSVGSGVSNGFTTDFNEALKYAYENNVFVVTAAGNGDVLNGKGIDLNNVPQSPVCNDVDGNNTVFGVGASEVEVIGGEQYRTEWSNYGGCVDIFAPGTDIMSLKASGNTYSHEDGTSFSAPIISGLAADILTAYPNMRNYTLSNFLIENGNANGGFVNAEELYKAIKANYVDEGGFTQNITGTLPSTATEYASKTTFSDLSSVHKNAAAINYLAEIGVLQGYSDGTFKPDQNVNRAELLKILIKGGLGIEPDLSYNKKCFPDVNEGDWFAVYVCYAKDNGWIEGYPDGTFQPGKTVNKVEALKMLVMTNNVVAASDTLLPYIDVEDNAWYTRYVKATYALNLLEESGNQLGVGGDVSRGSISENIFRLVLVNATGADQYSSELINEL